VNALTWAGDFVIGVLGLLYGIDEAQKAWTQLNSLMAWCAWVNPSP